VTNEQVRLMVGEQHSYTIRENKETGFVIYSEATHFEEQLWKGKLKAEEQEGSQGSRCPTTL